MHLKVCVDIIFIFHTHIHTHYGFVKSVSSLPISVRYGSGQITKKLTDLEFYMRQTEILSEIMISLLFILQELAQTQWKDL
jgi:hypothetical protein